MKTQLYINGEFTAPLKGGYFAAINPADESEFAQVASAESADVDRAVKAARAAFDQGIWSDKTGTERALILRKIATGIRDNLQHLANLEMVDNGKPLPEAEWDINDAAVCFDYYANLAEKSDQQPVATVDVEDDRFDSRIWMEPVGVVAAITPWNFPMLMAVWKVAPALAAGCCVVLKPSELCSITCVELARIIHAAGVPAGVFNLLTGFGPDAGAPLSEHPLIDKIAFTGSVATGKSVMQAAATGIRSVSLELGGKSPFIIFGDCDLDKAVEWILFGIFWNKGEVCSATSRILVEDSIYPELLERLKTATEQIVIGPGDKDGVKLGPLVSKSQYDKVLGFVERAKTSGARLVSGGAAASGFDKGYYIQPTIYADVPLDAEIWCEEIFGPVVCVVPFRDEQDALQKANASPFGLAGAVMSDDLDRCDRIAQKLRAGIVWINCSQPTFVQVPWGGFKSSGIGRELGEAGYNAYLETKQVTRFDHQQDWGWYASGESQNEQ